MWVVHSLTWHQSAVSIWIVAAEDRIGFVAIHNNVECSNGFSSRCTAKVLAVDGTLIAPAIDVILGMLSELDSLIQTLSQLGYL